MFVIYGVRTAGRVVTEGRKVSTRFFHLFFVPVVPLGSLEVRVENLLHDEGLPTSLAWKSVVAAYLRSLPLWSVGVGFVMAMSGAIANGMKPSERTNLIMLGAEILVGSYLVWYWAMFVLGRTADSFAFPKVVRTMGLAPLFLGCGIIAATAMTHKEPEDAVRKVVNDRSISDEEAVTRLARMTFSESEIQTRTEEDGGVGVDVAYTVSANPRSQRGSDRSGENWLQLTRTRCVTPMAIGLRELIRAGEERGLARVRVVISLAGRDAQGNPTLREVYAVNVSREQFSKVLALKTDSEFVLWSWKKLAELGVVEFDRFSEGP